MKVLIIGGVAAGTKAAAKLKRMNPQRCYHPHQGKGHFLCWLWHAILCWPD